ncbi:MAG: ArsR/SmtB family transcription factor [Candidatus Woesearchaeota archaeon]
MSKKKLVMVDLSEDKAKKVAKAITNNSCRKILEFLADKEATATEISRQLKVPLSTVHYNLSQLVEAELVISEDYHYSEKMKEVLHYKLANQYILIAPKSSEGFNLKEKLKNLLPVISFTAIGGLLINFYDNLTSGLKSLFIRPQETMMLPASEDVAVRAMDYESTQAMIQTTEPNFIFWFFLGAGFVIILWLAFDYIKFLRGKK